KQTSSNLGGMAPESNLFRPVSRVPLSLLVARQLREAIVSGELAMGSQLPTEQELTERFGVSRSTVREALRVLQAQGLLSGGGTARLHRRLPGRRPPGHEPTKGHARPAGRRA